MSADPVDRRLRREKLTLSILLPAIAACVLAGCIGFGMTGDARWLLLLAALLLFAGK